MNKLLENMTQKQKLKLRVLDKINKKRNPFQKNKFKVSVAVSFGCIVLVVALTQVPYVQAQVMPGFSKFTSWMQEVTQIPVKIPGAWQQSYEENKGTQFDQNVKERPLNNELVEKIEEENVLPEGEPKYIYYEVSRTNDSYSISAYRVKVPVPVNDRATLLEKNGPVSQADVIGYISGEKITEKNESLMDVFDFPENVEEFEIIPGVKAQKDMELGCIVWWKQGNWDFYYNGSNYGVDSHLKRMAEEWQNTPDALTSLKGSIRMAEGNKFHAFVTWEQNGFRYNYTVPHSDWKGIKDVISNFGDTALQLN